MGKNGGGTYCTPLAVVERMSGIGIESSQCVSKPLHHSLVVRAAYEMWGNIIPPPSTPKVRTGSLGGRSGKAVVEGSRSVREVHLRRETIRSIEETMWVGGAM